MRILNLVAGVIALGVAVSACAVSDGDPADEPSHQATAVQALTNACDRCIDTAQRDGNYWLIPECLRVVCAQQ